MTAGQISWVMPQGSPEPVDEVGMSFTGRQSTRKFPAGSKRAITETNSGEQIARAVRVEELRRLVAAGRYQVEPQKLAMSILTRALRDDAE